MLGKKPAVPVLEEKKNCVGLAILHFPAVNIRQMTGANISSVDTCVTDYMYLYP